MFRNENWKNGFVTSHFSRATIVSPAEAGPTRIGNGKRTWISRLSRLKISSAVSGSIEKSAGSKVKGKAFPLDLLQIITPPYDFQTNMFAFHWIATVIALRKQFLFSLLFFHF